MMIMRMYAWWLTCILYLINIMYDGSPVPSPIEVASLAVQLCHPGTTFSPTPKSSLWSPWSWPWSSSSSLWSSSSSTYHESAPCNLHPNMDLHTDSCPRPCTCQASTLLQFVVTNKQQNLSSSVLNTPIVPISVIPIAVVPVVRITVPVPLPSVVEVVLVPVATQIYFLGTCGYTNVFFSNLKLRSSVIL